MLFAAASDKRKTETDASQSRPDDRQIKGPKQTTVPDSIRVGFSTANVSHFLGSPSLRKKRASGADEQAGKELNAAENFGDAVGYQIRDATSGEADESDERAEAGSDAASHASHLPTQSRNVAESRVSAALPDDGYGARVRIEFRVITPPESRQKHLQTVILFLSFHGAFEPIRHVETEAAE